MVRRRRFSPFRDLWEIQDRMQDLFRGIEGEVLGEEGELESRGAQRLFCDVVERDGEIAVTADLPGVEKGDIYIECTGDELSITAEKKSEVEEETEGYIRRERRSGSYKRRIKLPTDVDCDAVEASFQNGVLEITLPKVEATEGKEIEIK